MTLDPQLTTNNPIVYLFAFMLPNAYWEGGLREL